MSSTYRILCLSHDPATTHGEYPTPEEADAAIAAGLDEHPRCDLAIGRYSYPLVEVGCPTSRHQPAHLRCGHSATVWTDRDWLRLLVAARQSDDERVRAVAASLRRYCWPTERLARLHLELGIPQPPAA
ncbi:hypothetical protein [Streptomyces fradiae]|uniref:hypothetical protein n=1 Tax=Streptomyces fradiae TaxID=1906 RepID=UPI0037015AE2